MAVARLDAVATAEQLVGDVEGRQNREPQRIARRGRFGGRPHLVVDESGQPRHVVGVERGADWIPLALNFDRNDAGVIGHPPYRFKASSCSSMSVTRVRMTSRSSRSADSS